MVLDGEAQAVAAAVAEAARFCAEGQLEAAGAVYQDIVAQHPDCGAAWFGLGVLGMQIGDNETAVTFFEQARAVGLADPACLINLGESYRRLGQLPLAADTLAQACQEAPASRDAHFNLGVVLAEGRQYGQALEHIERAIELDPGFVEAWRSKAEIHRNMVQLDEAETAFTHLLELVPDHGEAFLGRGETRRLKKDFVGAMEDFEALLAKNDGHLQALTGLGAIAFEQKDYAAAESLYRRVLALAPRHWEAVFGLGLVLLRTDKLALAEEQFRLAVSLDEEKCDARFCLGEVLLHQDRYAESQACYREILERNQKSIPALLGIGIVALHVEQLRDAIVFFRRAVSIEPSNLDALNNLALAYFDLGLFSIAERIARQTIEMAGSGEGSDVAIQNLGQYQLRRGILAEGWRNTERRKSRRAGDKLPFPAWEGEPLAGKRILVWQDQGVGDVVFFATLFAEVIEQAAAVILECDKKLVPLLRRSFPAAIIVPRSPKHPLAQENIDFHCAGGSLPMMLRSDFSSFPRPPKSILVVDKPRRSYWCERLHMFGDGLKVGICWRSMLSRGRRNLSYSELSEWREIFAMPGVRFVNLQYDRCAEELAEVQALFGKEVANFREIDMLDDLDESAALISALDLVISAPTSVSMLAAAVGTPTYLATVHSDWSSLGRRRDPWFGQIRRYPRKWNQSWDEIFSTMAADIRRRFRLG